jgi:transposase
MVERSGVSAKVGQQLLKLEKQFFEQWHRWREGQINRHELKIFTTPIPQEIETVLHQASYLGFVKGKKTPWASTVRSCREILDVPQAAGSRRDGISGGRMGSP